MGSSRFPGKVLEDVHGQPALSRLVRRLRRCQRLDDIVVATTVNPKDDVLVDWAAGEGVALYRGSEDDVLQRVVEAQRFMESEIVVEITGDATLTDPAVVDLAVEAFLAGDCDVVSTSWERSYPLGIDAQAFLLSDLADVAERIDDPPVREHVSLYFYENPEIYRVQGLVAPASWRYPDYRFVLDYPEDLRLIREIYARLEPEHGDGFGLGEIVSVMQSDPSLAEINAHCAVKPIR